MTQQETIEFWKNLCFDVLSKYPEAHEWKPWIGGTLADGTPMNDPNLVFDLLHDGRKRAIRILQEDPQSQHDHAVWLNKFGEGVVDPPEVIEEMVFTYKSYRESSPIFSKLFNIWVDPQTTYDKMQNIVSSFAD